METIQIILKLLGPLFILFVGLICILFLHFYFKSIVYYIIMFSKKALNSVYDKIGEWIDDRLT